MSEWPHKKLVGWFKKNQRPLPWRKTKDPYKIWISEIMLQQTQVKTVLPYYKRWMKHFPDLKSLAVAPLPEVLKLWEGLGYYARARNIHRSAQAILYGHDGKFPSDRKAIRKLPGIGRYTAGAILSIAFGERAPVLDGNVARVFSRLFAILDPIDTPKGQKKLWDLAQKWVPEEDPGDFNQGLMELGATICLPSDPQCRLCPLAHFCKAHARRQELLFPRKAKKATAKKVRAVCAIIRLHGKVLIRQRPENGLWAHLWEFPTFRLPDRKMPTEFLRKELEKLGIAVTEMEKKATLKRSYTDHRENLEVYDCRMAGSAREALPPSRSNDFRWASRADLKRFAFPSAHGRIIREQLWQTPSC